MPENPDLLGAVLAGGESRRFGSPKALARFRGEPMALRAMRVLTSCCAEVILVGDGAVLEPLAPLAPVPDRIPGRGPLGGLHTALLEAAERGLAGVALLGCDMPLVSSALVELVLAEGDRSGRSASAPVSVGGSVPAGAGEGRLEPLCAWYSLECLPTAVSRLRRDDRSLQGLLKAVGAHPVSLDAMARVADPTLALRSANTPADLVALEELATE